MTDEQIERLNEILDRLNVVSDRIYNNTLVCEAKKCKHCEVSVFDERDITCMHSMKEFPFKLCKYYEVN